MDDSGEFNHSYLRVNEARDLAINRYSEKLNRWNPISQTMQARKTFISIVYKQIKEINEYLVLNERFRSTVEPWEDIHRMQQFFLDFYERFG